MKRKFSIFITLLLALVLCFALVACDTDPDDGKVNGGGKPPKKEEVIEKAVTSLGEYFGGDVYGGVFGYDLDTKNTEGLKGSYKFAKKNNEVYYKNGDDVRMLDLTTNMTYVKRQDGWIYDGELLPQGTFGYALAVIGNLADDNDSAIVESAANTDGAFTYDDIVYSSKNRTLTTEIKLAEKINRPLLPLQQVYEEEGSVKDLIDAYLWEYNDEIVSQVPLLKALGTLNVNKISDLVKMTLIAAQNENMITTLESFVGNDVGAKYEEFLKSQGVTGAALTAAKARTIGQAIEGALKYIENKIDLKAIADGDYSSVLGIVDSLINGGDEERAAVLGEMLQYVVFAEVDMKNYEKDVAGFVNMIVDILKAVKIKPLIDSLESIQIPGMSSTAGMVLGIAGPVIKEIIAKPVTFEKLDAKLTAKLDKEYAVESISIELIAKHDFKGETSLPILSDNDYSASFTLLLSGVPEELDIAEEIQLVKYADENGVVLDGGGYGIMNLDNGSDFGYYLETRMIENLSVDGIHSFVVSADGDIAEVETAIVSFDVNTSSFVYDYDAVSAAVAEELKNGSTALITTTATVHVGEIFNYTVNVRLFVVADSSTDSAEELITSLFTYAFGDTDAPTESSLR